MDNQHPADMEQSADYEQPVIEVRLPTSQPILTYILLAINILIFMWTTTLTDDQRELFILDFSKINAFVYQGEAYRLFTSMFMHITAEHMMGNAFMLFLYGRDVERYYGRFRFGLVYLLGGLAGSMGSVIYTDNNLQPSIGASGAIFAIFSAYAVFLYHHRRLFPSAMSGVLRMLFLAIVYVIFGLDESRSIDNGAHIGGLIGGILVAWFICPQLVLRKEPTYAIVDENTIERWIIMPILFSLGLAIMIFIVSIRGV